MYRREPEFAVDRAGAERLLEEAGRALEVAKQVRGAAGSLGASPPILIPHSLND
jgi:hypothetical protein